MKSWGTFAQHGLATLSHATERSCHKPLHSLGFEHTGLMLTANNHMTSLQNSWFIILLRATVPYVGIQAKQKNKTRLWSVWVHLSDYFRRALRNEDSCLPHHKTQLSVRTCQKATQAPGSNKGTMPAGLSMGDPDSLQRTASSMCIHTVMKALPFPLLPELV